MKYREVTVNHLIQGEHYWVYLPGMIGRIYWADLDLKLQRMKLRGIRDRDATKLPKGTRILGPVPAPFERRK